MKIVISGGSGFIGEGIARRLLARGDEVVVLSRNPAKVKAGRGVEWDGRSAGMWTAEINDADAVLNLAGENVGAGRWTAARKQRLIDSRINSTTAIVAALTSATRRNRTLVSASAVGYYGIDRDDEVDERSSKGAGFLADLTAEWERAANRAETVARVVILRFGVVLDGEGGALPKMMLPFRFGAGGPVGNGLQWMSWVDRDDALAAIPWAVDHEALRGVYNITSPHPVRNREFAKTLGAVLGRPAFLPAPAFALRLALGDMADEVLLGGQRALPRRTESEGFRFAYPTIESSLRHSLLPASGEKVPRSGG